MEVIIPEGGGYEFSVGDEDFELLKTIRHEASRWTTRYTSVLRHIETGKVYGYDYYRGNTESQENEYPDGKITLREMTPKTVVTEVWEYA